MGSSDCIVVLAAATLLSLSLLCSCSTHHAAIKGVDLGNPVIDVVPSRLTGYSSTRGSKDIFSCERVRVAGLSRLKLNCYASTFRVTLAPSVVIPERFYSKIQVCFHRNASLGICQCEDDEWKPVQKGIWSSFMSPYEDRYVDVKFIEVSGSVTVSVEEEFQQWRLLCLASGFILLLLAPIVSSWVPFYYSSSMAVGVLLVIIILLFQGMKLLPTGRKNVFYLTIYGSVLGAGSFLLHQFSVFVNSILTNFGLSEEMHNPVSIFVLVGIVLAGAALGYWIVRKFVISEDGSVDVGVAQFVKWAMRIIAATCIFQSTADTPLAVGTLGSCWAVCFLITSLKWENLQDLSYPGNRNLVLRRTRPKQSRAEFLSRSTKMGSRGTLWNSPNNSSAWSNSPVKGLISPSSGQSGGMRNEQEYYSTFHKTPTRKKLSKKEWENFTRESTKQAVAEWASSPEFTDWIVEHADRIHLLPNDSSDDSAASGSDSTKESPPPETGNPFTLFNWL